MPLRWTIRWEPGAQKSLDALDGHQRERIIRAVATLSADPYAARNAKALRGGGYRLRVGDWRVVYALRNEELLVLIVRLGHRREIYR